MAKKAVFDCQFSMTMSWGIGLGKHAGDYTSVKGSAGFALYSNTTKQALDWHVPCSSR